MELTKKTFLERLQYLQGELRAIAQSPELRLLLQNEYSNYDPDLTIIDALHAVSEVVDAYQSQENGYYPIADYLNSLARQYPQPDLKFLDNLASRYFGTNEPLYNLYLKKTLIAAVARIRTPGCKHDTLTILVGNPGIGKSTFLRHLFGDEWFTNQLAILTKKTR